MKKVEGGKVLEKKKKNKQFERGLEEENDGKDKEEKGELELCKKRILADLLVFLAPFSMIEMAFCFSMIEMEFCHQRSLVRIIGEVPSSLVRS